MQILQDIGLTQNEIKIYLYLLKAGSQTAYEIAKNTDIYRVHVYDKLEQLQNKGLATTIFQGAKKHFQATPPEKLTHYLQEKQELLKTQSSQLQETLPQLQALYSLPKVDTHVEVFKGKEGLKYFLKDIIKTKKEVSITGLDDQKYQQALPIFMQQYFRDLKRFKIKERVITQASKTIFEFDHHLAPTTTYRYLKTSQFNPTNTLIYDQKVVLVTWGTPITAVMIKNPSLAATYQDHFEKLWRLAKSKP